MSASAKPNETSMDEILASIRRIIADDEPLPRRQPERPADAPVHRPAAEAARPTGSLAGQAPVREHRFAAAPATDAADLMEGEEMPDYPYQGAAPGQPAPRRPEPAREQATAPRPAPARPAEPPRSAEPAPSRPHGENGRRKELLSPDVDAAVTAAFESLGDVVLPAHERTVEDLVKEILRPMLKTWLDDNLPRIVERLVRQEIERISRTSR
ncbi:DUF2497 domain-containing protein [Aquabacter sp. CN5-332]|uniref:DUF2497 domain-containing protein n=1 Tax=Aquabacter sp. CN5-332 TaxID=3156608 RepID=UPI0032B48116